MPSGRLRCIPSARDFCLALLAVACGLQATGRLPDRSWLPVLGWALALSIALSVVIALLLPLRRPAARGASRLARAVDSAPALVRVLAAALAAAMLLLGQVHRALDARLPPALEGVELELRGMVEGIPQRFVFGDRVRFVVVGCRPMVPTAARGCGRLDRVQLDWGAPRERDRGFRTQAPPDEEPQEPSPAARDDRGSGRAVRHGGSAAGDLVWAHPGTWWRLAVRLKRPVAPVNPGAFDLELRLLQQGIGAVGRVQARERLAGPPEGEGGWGAGAWFPRSPGAALLVAFEDWRTRLRDHLEHAKALHVDQPGAADRWPLMGIVTGLSLGDQGAIGASLWALFSRTGVSHLMAISGMHVTMLALVAGWLTGMALRRLARRPGWGQPGRLPRRAIVLAVALAVAFAYAMLSGWGIPAQRTCWMLLAAALLDAAGRRAGPLDPVLIAGGTVVAIDPWSVGTAGFWLSFGAVTAIMLCAHGREERRPRRESPAVSGHSPMSPAGVVAMLSLPAAVSMAGSLRAAVTSQWAATVGLAPMVVALFSTLSLVGPVANALAIPWVSFLVTPIAIAAALAGPLSPTLCAMLLSLDLWLIETMISMLRFLDGLPGASAAIARPDPWTLAAAMIGAAVLVAPPGVPLRAAGVPCLLPLLLAPQRLPEPDALWITALDIGQGSSILVESGQARLLYDAGPGQGGDRSAAARFLVPYLRSRGIERIDALVVSHLDAGHAGGAAAVVALLRPKLIVTSFDPRLLALDEDARGALAHVRCESGSRLVVGGMRLDMLHPPAVASLRRDARDDAASCVLRVATGAGSVLLAGDLPAAADAPLVAAAGDRLRASVLVVPQQGGRHAASKALLDAVGPSHALLQVGYRNRHRHPHPEVLARLARSRVQVLRTDQDGAVQVRLRTGAAATVVRQRREAPPYWRLPVNGMADGW